MKQHKFNTYAPKMPPKRKISHLGQVDFVVITTIKKELTKVSSPSHTPSGVRIYHKFKTTN